MIKLIYKIGEDNFYVPGADKQISNEDGPIPKGFTDKIPMHEVDGNLVGYYKAKWNGNDWEEGATKEEIDIINHSGQVQPPTITERLSAIEDAITTIMGV